jgi:hypothetical protein
MAADGSLPTHGSPGSRAILLQAARTLISDVRSERSLLAADSAERQFYLGVEAAAEEMVRPELQATRDARWLEGQPSPFREGYVSTTNTLARAAAAPDPPLRLPVPRFRDRR